jgi:hypothetical protein
MEVVGYKAPAFRHPPTLKAYAKHLVFPAADAFLNMGNCYQLDSVS